MTHREHLISKGLLRPNAAIVIGKKVVRIGQEQDGDPSPSVWHDAPTVRLDAATKRETSGS